MRFETSSKICRHIFTLAVVRGTIMGRSVSICKVFMIPQICFMVRPKRAARKKLMVSDPVRVLSRLLNSALVLLVEAIFP